MTSSSSRLRQESASTGKETRPGRPDRRAKVALSDRPAPKKSLGQHFLSDRNILRRIADATGISGRETVIEIGAGPGDLTAELATRAARVFAVELDAALCLGLRERFAGTANVTVVNEDALTLDPASLVDGGGEYVLAGNLPYNAATAIIRHFLESESPPRTLVVMLQKEVAESMLATPGEMGLLAVGVQVYASGRRLFDVAPGAFYPPPKVKSTVVRLDVRDRPLVPGEERERFFRVVRAGFSAPRKQLRNSLANGLGLPPGRCEAAIRAADLDPSSRPGRLSVAEWLALSRKVDGPTD